MAALHGRFLPIFHSIVTQRRGRLLQTDAASPEGLLTAALSKPLSQKPIHRSLYCRAAVGISPATSESSVPSSPSSPIAKHLRGFLTDDVGPNPTVLEAQAKICTGPTQSKPLTGEALAKVLELILQSGGSPKRTNIHC